jgi:hypothetical protein
MPKIKQKIKYINATQFLIPYRHQAGDMFTKPAVRKCFGSAPLSFHSSLLGDTIDRFIIWSLFFCCDTLLFFSP